MGVSAPIDSELDERFERLSLAGSGGMGRVFRARDRASGEIVALKLLVNESGEPLRFAREAHVLSSVDHPAVVRYRESGVTRDGAPYLVMEWLTGQDLENRLSLGALDVESTIAIGKRVAEALAATHRRGIVHRDLKPANVFLVDGLPENAKVIDFGIARSTTTDALTVSGTVIGTPAYMSPEQVRGSEFDARTDLYGLGVVLFCCLVGRPPFGGPHDVAVLAKVVLEAPPPLRSLRPDVPESLARLVARMLAKTPENRPDDAVLVLEDLRAIEATLQRATNDAPASLSGASVPGGERRVISFVLCNLRAPRDEQGTLVQRRTPARVESATLVSGPPGNEDVVSSFGGTLHRLAQDARLVTIRGAASPADEAVRAARCGLALSQMHPSAPVVVATGRVVVTGDVQVGRAIDRAASAIVAAVGGGVRIDETSADLVGERFEIEGEGEWRVLVGERRSTAPMSVRRTAPLVGRARELGQLQGSFAECLEEPRAQIALITAAAGLGKSRLVHELVGNTIAARPDVEIVFAQGDSVRAGASFGIAAQILQSRAAIVEDDDAGKRAVKLRTLVEHDFPADAARRAEEMLGEICGVYTPASAASPELRAARADHATMSDVVTEVWIAWLRARVARGPVVLVIEDLHWADLPSLRLVDAALGALEDRPLFVLATARPEVHTTFPAMFRRRVVQEITLSALTRRAAENLAREILGAHATDDVVAAVVERAAGHPFYLEELVRAVVQGERTSALPDSVLGMIQARLDELSPAARHVLRVASVFGERFTERGVSALCSDDERRELPALLRALVEQEVVVRPARTSGDHAFRHALLREGAYATLTDEARVVAHRLAGEWLSRSGDEDPALLAEHFSIGEQPARALPFYVQAARRALEGDDLARAATLAERATACAPDERTAATIAAIHAEVAFWRGDLERAVEHAEHAIAALPRGSAEWFGAASIAISAAGQRGKNDDVARWMERVGAEEARDDARDARAVALCRAMTQLLWAHQRAPIGDVVSTFDVATLDDFAAGWVYRARAEIAWVRDRDVDRCLAAFTHSRARFETTRAARHLVLTMANEASLSAWSADFDRASSLVARAEVEATRLGSGFLASYATAVHGMTQIYAGHADGEATMTRALQALGGSPRLSFICRFFLGWRALDRGEMPMAEEHARAAASAAVVDDLRCAGGALLARVLLAMGKMDEAHDAARAAMELRARCVDLELTEGIVELVLAEVQRAMGDEPAARRTIAPAHERLQAIAATIENAEHRARFWARAVGNAEIAAFVR